MLTFLFQHTPPMTPGQYLMGSPRWTRAVSLVNARLVCKAGASTAPAILQMEVGGTLVDKRLAVLPIDASEEVRQVYPLNYIVPANTEVRFKCVSGPAGEADAIREVGLNLTATLASADSIAGAEPSLVSDLWVRWINGSEDLRLFEYDPATHQFAESVAGLSAGRASIVNGPNCTMTIDGSAALTVDASQVLQVARVTAIGGTAAAAYPRLEFWRGGTGLQPVRLASLTKTGHLTIVDLAEALSLTGGDDRFELYGNGVLAAIIGPVRLTALNFHETTG